MRKLEREDKKVRMITEDIPHTFGGKKMPPGYNWATDIRGFKKGGRIPSNRCFHCGYRFVGSEIAAFCCICDHAMAVGGEEMLMGFSYERRDARIRIPEDVSEEQYIKKMQSIADLPTHPQHNSFMKTEDLV